MNNVYYFLLLFFIISPLFNRVGWRLSKNILYVLPTPVSFTLTILWGFLVFFVFNIVANYFNPYFYFELFYSLLNGMYCSNPAFGLFKEDTITIDVLTKHKIINIVGVIVFVALTISNIIFNFI